jgi:YebC/PmpR family DNA-binding regulatory protein
MAGHSKWAQIKRQKGKNDQARGQVFTKMAREITVAVREGGSGDIEGNFRLRQAVTRAKAAGVPNDNIDRAIQKGLGAGAEGAGFESIQYEGYGPGGVAIMIDALTDNRNRTAGDIRSYFNKADGNLGESGSVNWMFQKKGVIRLAAVEDFDSFFLEVADAGAEDVREDEDMLEILTAPADFEKVVKSLSGYELESAEVLYLPQNTVTVSQADVAKKLLKLMDLLEDHDDVQQVHSNFELDEALLAQIS